MIALLIASIIIGRAWLPKKHPSALFPTSTKLGGVDSVDADGF